MGYMSSILQGSFSDDIQKRQKALNQSFPTKCVLEQPQQKLNCPFGLSETPGHVWWDNAFTPHQSFSFSECA